MYTVTWSRYGRTAGTKEFAARADALSFFNYIRRQSGVGRAELKTL